MPRRKVSLYEAKTNLSRLVRQVREGGSVVITVHGEPMAELNAVERPRKGVRVQTIAARLAELEARGEVIPAKMQPGDPRAFPVGKPKPGALKRFLEERHRD
jgi:prevent-host-death family protein